MKIVFFDGYCNLCNSWIDWLIRHDSSKNIQFASLQGTTAAPLLKQHHLESMDSILYFKDSVFYQRSTAVLLILADLGGAWKLAKIFFLIPTFLRDILYKWVAANRYRIFGKRNTCRIPTAEEKNRLLP